MPDFPIGHRLVRSVNPGDRQRFTSLPPTGHDTLLHYVPIQPRACFLTTTYKF